MDRDNPAPRHPPPVREGVGQCPARWLTHEEAYGHLIPTCQDGTELRARDEVVLRLGLGGMWAAEIMALTIGNLRLTDSPSEIAWIGKASRPRRMVPREATARAPGRLPRPSPSEASLYPAIPSSAARSPAAAAPSCPGANPDTLTLKGSAGRTAFLGESLTPTPPGCDSLGNRPGRRTLPAVRDGEPRVGGVAKAQSSNHPDELVQPLDLVLKGRRSQGRQRCSEGRLLRSSTVARREHQPVQQFVHPDPQAVRQTENDDE